MLPARIIGIAGRIVCDPEEGMCGIGRNVSTDARKVLKSTKIIVME